MVDCEHPDETLRTVWLRMQSSQPVSCALWCEVCGAFAVRLTADAWSEWTLPRVALTRHFAISRGEALCGNLFGIHTAVARDVDCVPCLKVAAANIGTWIAEGIEHLLRLRFMRGIR